MNPVQICETIKRQFEQADFTVENITLNLSDHLYCVTLADGTDIAGEYSETGDVITQGRATVPTYTPGLTKLGLEARGYHRFSWNNGDIIEYWKGTSKDPNDFDSRIGVRFGEWKHIPFLVWLVFPGYMVPLKHIKNYDDLEQLYRLIKWQEDLHPSREKTHKGVTHV